MMESATLNKSGKNDASMYRKKILIFVILESDQMYGLTVGKDYPKIEILEEESREDNMIVASWINDFNTGQKEFDVTIFLLISFRTR